MPFPPEFSFDSEERFTADFVMPLLTRLGFSIVLNYHGTSEFGKDLVVGEFDRFFHVRYHGIQIKYKPSISLSDSSDLIQDCQQAFANTFQHPHTGVENRISSFYIINGGTISNEARAHFFASVHSTFSDNTRLLDGKSLIQLDRAATIVGVEPIRSVLSGLLFEIRFNEKVVSDICISLKRLIESDGPYPMQRLRVMAISSYLQRPDGTLIEQLTMLEEYWQFVASFNRIVDSIGTPIWAGDYKKRRVEGAYTVRDEIDRLSGLLAPVVKSRLDQLGPLVSP